MGPAARVPDQPALPRLPAGLVLEQMVSVGLAVVRCDKDRCRISFCTIGSRFFWSAATDDLFSGLAAFSYYIYHCGRMAGAVWEL